MCKDVLTDRTATMSEPGSPGRTLRGSGDGMDEKTALAGAGRGKASPGAVEVSVLEAASDAVPVPVRKPSGKRRGSVVPARWRGGG